MGKTHSSDKLKATTANNQFMINNYLINRKKKLGDGHTASVYMATNLLNDKIVAAKVIKKDQIIPIDLSLAYTEIKTLKILSHQNIVKLYDTYDDDDTLILFLELGKEGDLYTYLEKNNNVTEQMARKIFIQLLNAIDYAHKNNIVHRDIKLENILIKKICDNDEPFILLADWGFSEFVSSTDTTLLQSCGSLSYAAPELFLGKKYIGQCVDIWSLAIVLYTLIVRHNPFNGKSTEEIMKKILYTNPIYPSTLSTELILLLNGMLDKQPERRATISIIRNFEWFNATS